MSALTDRQSEVLDDLRGWGGKWVRPMDIGGRNGSDHSAVLAQLERKGLVESRQRFGSPHGARGSKVYRAVPDE